MENDFELISSLVGRYAILDFFAIFLAEYFPYLVAGFFLIVLFLHKDRQRRLFVLFFWLLSTVIASGIIVPVIRSIYFRARPFVFYDFVPLINISARVPSFPSAHTVFFFTLATVVFLSFSRYWGAWLYLFAALIGAARVFVGVHYPLDILAGAFIGFMVPFLLRLFLPWSPHVENKAGDQTNELSGFREAVE